MNRLVLVAVAAMSAILLSSPAIGGRDAGQMMQQERAKRPLRSSAPRKRRHARKQLQSSRCLSIMVCGPRQHLGSTNSAA